MKIAVASGKGGTGKTTVAVSLAQTLAETDLAPVLISDCDVEAPNAHLFLNPLWTDEKKVNLYVPEINPSLCSGCGTCAEVCQFNAVVMLKDKPKVFPALCHGCGSCTLQCPEKAITEIPRQIGKLERGTAGENLVLRQGLLQEGEPMAVPIIGALKKWEEIPPPVVEILDSPPGASCPVVETIRGADYVLLVTEPTPFGLHDLKQAVGLTRELGVQVGVILNRVGVGTEDIVGYCQTQDVPVMMEIPLDRKIGEGLARGQSLLEIRPEYRKEFSEIWGKIQSAREGIEL